MAQPQHVLRGYKQILQLIQRLPEAKRMDALSEARTSFRSNVAAESSAVEGLVKELDDKIKFLKMITPRRMKEKRGAGNFLFKEGAVVEGRGEYLGRKGQGEAWMHGGGGGFSPAATRSDTAGCGGGGCGHSHH